MKYASLRDRLVLAICPSVSGGGGIVPDLSGYNNHGTLNNMEAVDYVSYQRGVACNFEGTNNNIQTSTSFCLTNQFTLSLWMRSSNISQPNTYLFSALDSSLADNAYSIIYGFVSQRVEFYAGATIGGFRTNSQITIADTNPNHLAYTYDGRQMLSYLNGQVVNTNSFASATLNAPNGPLYLGNFGPSFARFFNGLLDDARSYQRALSSQEIQLLASEPGIGLRPERTSVFFGAQLFNAAWARNSNVILSPVGAA